jgi:predicted enzyme related to lactoylglutathione lyase
VTRSQNAGAVIYAKDIHRLGTFYEQVAGLTITHAEDDHLVLASDAIQLVLVVVPAWLAASIEVTVPPRVREDTAIKLVLPVPDLAAARMTAQALGGQLQPAEREWVFQGLRVCDGHDPEGNVVQFRQCLD